jgi:hypothetical protein
MGAGRMQFYNLRRIGKEATELGAPKLAPATLILNGANPTDPKNTFPGDKTKILPAYQEYYYTCANAGKLGTAYWTFRPFALTFTLPDKDAKSYRFTLTETVNSWTGGEADRFGDVDWTPEKVNVKSTGLDKQQPIDPTAANYYNGDHGEISWGLVTPPGAPAQVAQVVITDCPQLVANFRMSFKEQVTQTITATNQAGVSETWEFSFTNTFVAGGSGPTFVPGTIKKVIPSSGGTK